MTLAYAKEKHITYLNKCLEGVIETHGMYCGLNNKIDAENEKVMDYYRKQIDACNKSKSC